MCLTPAIAILPLSGISIFLTAAFQFYFYIKFGPLTKSHEDAFFTSFQASFLFLVTLAPIAYTIFKKKYRSWFLISFVQIGLVLSCVFSFESMNYFYKPITKKDLVTFFELHMQEYHREPPYLEFFQRHLKLSDGMEKCCGILSYEDYLNVPFPLESNFYLSKHRRMRFYIPVSCCKPTVAHCTDYLATVARPFLGNTVEKSKEFNETLRNFINTRGCLENGVDPNPELNMFNAQRILLNEISFLIPFYILLNIAVFNFYFYYGITDKEFTLFYSNEETKQN